VILINSFQLLTNDTNGFGLFRDNQTQPEHLGGTEESSRARLTIDCRDLPASIFKSRMPYIAHIETLRAGPMSRCNIRENDMRRIIAVKNEMRKAAGIISSVSAMVSIILVCHDFGRPVIPTFSF